MGRVKQAMLEEQFEDVFCEESPSYNPYEFAGWDDDLEMDVDKTISENYIYQKEIYKDDLYEYLYDIKKQQEWNEEWEEAEGRRLYEEMRRQSSPGCLVVCLQWLACVTVICIVVFICMCIFNFLGIDTY